MDLDEVRLRLLRNDDVPATNPFNLSYRFGLQDTKQNIVAGVPQPNGLLAHWVEAYIFPANRSRKAKGVEMSFHPFCFQVR
jgi:hypothetical protein